MMIMLKVRPVVSPAVFSNKVNVLADPGIFMLLFTPTSSRRGVCRHHRNNLKLLEGKTPREQNQYGNNN